MSAEHDELMSELAQNRAFDLLERQARMDNVVSLNEGNRTVVKMNEAAAELSRARARFWRILGSLIVTTWITSLVWATLWLIHLIT